MKKIVPPTNETFARIRVVGVGGSGGNVINHMIKSGLTNVEFIAANTDLQDLQNSKSTKKIHLGRRTTQGLGAGMNPALGEKAALESIEEIKESIKGADIIFIACGMGGGTGTGAAPVFAKVAQDLGILTISVITKPFSFEGSQRKIISDQGIEKLSLNTDSLVIIPNDSVLAISSDKTTMSEAFALCDEVLNQAVSGVSQLIVRAGDINIDFADLNTIMKKSGNALLGIGSGRGANKAEIAITKAMSSPLLETSIKGAQRVLYSIASRTRSEITMKEVQIIAERISENVDPGAKIIFGTVTDKNLRQGEVRVTLIATDLIDNNVQPNVQIIENKKSKDAIKAPVRRLRDFEIDDKETKVISLGDEYDYNDEDNDEEYDESDKKQPIEAIKNLWKKK